jgi:hypothetical protein
LKNTAPIKKSKRVKKTKKVLYRIRNWSLYNKSLIQRGDITIWFSETAIADWLYSGKRLQGAPVKYGDIAIQTALITRSLFSLTLRSCQGFMHSLTKLMAIAVPVPNYTTICRRQRTLTVPCISHKESNEPLHVVVDSTGLKVFGEGEWKVRKHGYSKHRMWRKLHLALNPATGDIMSYSLTTNSVTDEQALPVLLNAIADPIHTLTGDGAYDKWSVYRILQSRGILPIIPPRKNARIKRHGNGHADPLARDEAIRAIRVFGRRRWKQNIGYHRRSLSETAMFRYKTLFGDKPLAHSLGNQKVEAGINCLILNKFTSFGRPLSCPVAA